jgi:hypothetical protein
MSTIIDRRPKPAVASPTADMAAHLAMVAAMALAVAKIVARCNYCRVHEARDIRRTRREQPRIGNENSRQFKGVRGLEKRNDVLISAFTPHTESA